MKTRKHTTRSIGWFSAAMGIGTAVMTAATCALFGHRLGLPSLLGSVPGNGLAAMLPLAVPALAVCAALACTRSGSFQRSRAAGFSTGVFLGAPALLALVILC